ncbi:MAG: hypothetical protein JWM75_968 [Sphingomonas bacterium]|nr:hypothetical protein [Sphingomonas bacterium]
MNGGVRTMQIAAYALLMLAGSDVLPTAALRIARQADCVAMPQLMSAWRLPDRAVGSAIRPQALRRKPGRCLRLSLR